MLVESLRDCSSLSTTAGDFWRDFDDKAEGGVIGGADGVTSSFGSQSSATFEHQHQQVKERHDFGICVKFVWARPRAAWCLAILTCLFTLASLLRGWRVGGGERLSSFTSWRL